MQSYLKDLGIDVSLTVESDSNSARPFASRLGLGRQRHVHTRYLWLQDAVASKRLLVKRVPTRDNVSDILTKPCDATTLNTHLTTMHVCQVVASTLHEQVTGSPGAAT